jgi:RNA polymerase sigma-70 factor, ECF subfamily
MNDGAVSCRHSHDARGPKVPPAETSGEECAAVLHCPRFSKDMKRVTPLIRSDAAEEQAATASETRLKELLERYGAFLRRTIVHVCPRAMGLSYDDIEQEARVRLWSALKNERDIAHPVSYLYKVAVSVTIRAIRRAKARREEPLPEQGGAPGETPFETLQADPDASPDAVAERHEWIRKLDAALARLQENRRLAVSLHLQGMTTPEIAALLGWTEPKARNLVHRGLKDLRRHLRAEGIEYAR